MFVGTSVRSIYFTYKYMCIQRYLGEIERRAAWIPAENNPRLARGKSTSIVFGIVDNTIPIRLLDYLISMRGLTSI